MLKRFFIVCIFFVIFYMSSVFTAFDDKTIKIGTSLPLTSTNESYGKNVLYGINAYFNYVNENNILGERKIQLLAYDDKYEPSLTFENFNKLIDENIFAFYGFVGTPTTKKIFPYLENFDIPFFAPFTGAGFLRENNNENIVNFRTSYKHEIESLVDYLLKQNIKKFAVFYQNDDYGEEGYIALVETLHKNHILLETEGSYKRNTLAINHAFNEIKIQKPEVIFMIGAYKANALFIKKAKKDKDFEDTIFCNISFGDGDSMINELKKMKIDTKNLLFSQVVPNYHNRSIPIVRQYQDLMTKYYPDIHYGFVSLEAFLSANVLVDAIKKNDSVLSQESFLKELKNIDSKNILDGLQLQYKNKQLLNKSYLFTYENGIFKEIEK